MNTESQPTVSASLLLRRGLKSMSPPRQLRTPAYPPGVHSPLPSDIRWVVPTMLVEVSHDGWTVAGMLRGAELVSVVSRES